MPKVIHAEAAGPDERLGRPNGDSEIDLGNFAEPLNIQQQRPEPVQFRERSLNESGPLLLVTYDGQVEAVVGVRSASAATFPDVPDSIGVDAGVARQQPVYIERGRADPQDGEKHFVILPQFYCEWAGDQAPETTRDQAQKQQSPRVSEA